MTFALLAACIHFLTPTPAADTARFVAGAPPGDAPIRYTAIDDGIGRASTRDGKACLLTDAAGGNGYLYFDVRRGWLKEHGHAPYRIELTVEYHDTGTDAIAVQYDATGNAVADNFREVAWRKEGTGRWRTRTVVMEDAEMRNSQHGQADLRIGAGPDGDEAVASLTLRVLAASSTPEARPVVPEPHPPRPDEIRVALDRVAFAPAGAASEAERIARDRLTVRLREIGARIGGPTPTTLVTGTWRPEWAKRYPRTARRVRTLASEAAAFRRRDGFVVCVERTGKRPVVCAVGLEPPGAVYALGALHERALRDGSHAALLLPRNPPADLPALERRELYLNIGYGLRRPGITVEDWSDADWREFVDRLVLARYNTWSFFLWGDTETLHPESANGPLNRRLHETLRRAIAYSHRRGVKVGLQISPTIVPVALWEKHPELRAQLEYVYPGVLCPSRPDAVKIQRAVHEPEVRWFASCDFVSLWFYDIGGCFCDRCLPGARQMRSLLAQVDTWSEIVHKANPRAAFQVMAWGIWRYEKRHSYSIREPFVAALPARFAGRALTIADGTMTDPGTQPLFETIRRARVPAAAFLYQTNIETGQPFPIVQSRYLRTNLATAQRAGATGAFLMRMEAGTRLADDMVAGRFLWNPKTDTGAALLATARQLTGDVRAARQACAALQRMDDFAWFGYVGGGADAAKGARIRSLAQAAVASAPAPFRTRLEWLRAAGDGYQILGRAVEARDDEDAAAVAACDTDFAAAMRRSPLLRTQMGDAPYWKALFTQSLVRFFHGGWAASPF